MTRRGPIIGLTAAIGVLAVAAGVWWLEHSRAGLAADEAQALVDTYCVECHNAVDLAGSLRLDDKPVAELEAHAEVYEQVVRKLGTGMMPPAGEPRPEREALDALAAAFETRLDRAAADGPVTARTELRRLNRTEYENAIRDLLHLDIDAAAYLPLDDSSEGFDNMAAALGVSPALIESYVAAAMKLSRQAIGDPTAPRTQVAYRVPEGLAQDRHIEGLPLGTRGGLSVRHHFPLDAVYEISVGRGFRGGQVDLTIDGLPVESTGRGSYRVPVTAGPHMLTVALVETRRSAGVDDIYSAPRSTAGLSGIEIDGPFEPTGVGDTPSRRRILSCIPEVPAEEADCAREILAILAGRAFRRPLEPDDLPALLEFYESGREQGGFEAGIQQALARILVDPRFIYRFEPEPDVAPGTVFEVDDYALASRLSFFLWSSIPDDALLEAAASGSLSEPAGLEAQVRRMLADPKAMALVDDFAAQWLFLRELDSLTPDAESFDENLRRSMQRETLMLVESVLEEDASILRLIDADYSFVDERLAEHYGIPGVKGSHFRRVALPADGPRRGLLGHGSILTLTSVTNRTSPVIRGSWILENLLGAPAPVPPPGVETTLEGDDGAAVAETVRERLEAHRANPTCASCHAIMDPVGLTLENFDLIGAWRETEGGRPIDASATLVDGTVVEGPADLRAALIGRSEAFVTAATEKLLTYALGRRLEYFDMPTVRAIVRDAAEDDYRFSALVAGVVRSVPFRTQVKGETD